MSNDCRINVEKCSNKNEICNPYTGRCVGVDSTTAFKIAKNLLLDSNNFKQNRKIEQGKQLEKLSIVYGKPFGKTWEKFYLNNKIEIEIEEVKPKKTKKNKLKVNEDEKDCRKNPQKCIVEREICNKDTGRCIQNGSQKVYNIAKNLLLEGIQLKKHNLDKKGDVLIQQAQQYGKVFGKKWTKLVSKHLEPPKKILEPPKKNLETEKEFITKYQDFALLLENLNIQVMEIDNSQEKLLLLISNYQRYLELDLIDILEFSKPIEYYWKRLKLWETSIKEMTTIIGQLQPKIPSKTASPYILGSPKSNSTLANIPDTNKDVIMVFHSNFDHNQAFDKDGDQGLFTILKQMKHFSFKYYKIGSISDIEKKIKQLKTNQKIAHLIIMAHGSQDGMTLGKNERVSIKDNSIHRLANSIKPKLANNCSILLHSCLVGKGGINGNNFSNKLSKLLPNHTIFGSEKSIRRGDLLVLVAEEDYQNNVLNMVYEIDDSCDYQMYSFRNNTHNKGGFNKNIVWYRIVV